MLNVWGWSLAMLGIVFVILWGMLGAGNMVRAYRAGEMSGTVERVVSAGSLARWE